jgi:hypothetical protein
MVRVQPVAAVAPGRRSRRDTLAQSLQQEPPRWQVQILDENETWVTSLDASSRSVATAGITSTWGSHGLMPKGNRSGHSTVASMRQILGSDCSVGILNEALEHRSDRPLGASALSRTAKARRKL